jgi:hypothetical protein
MATTVHFISNAPDARLFNVWINLREFTVALNVAHQIKRKLSLEFMQEVLISVQYRLMHLVYNIQDTQEVLRIAILAMSTSVFFGSHSIPEHFRCLAGEFRNALQSVEQHLSDQWLRLKLWLIFVGKLSVLRDPRDSSWLTKQLLEIKVALGLRNGLRQGKF